MWLFISLVAVGFVAYHVHRRQLPSPRQVLAYLVAIYAVTAFWAGFHLAVTEDALGRHGQGVTGTLGEKISTTGEQATRTFGSRFPTPLILTDGDPLYDVLARMVATGAADSWAVDYNFPCDDAQPCRGRAFVSHTRWLQMRAGDAISVRYVKGSMGGARLSDQSQWPTAIARMAIGIALLAAAVLIAGTPRPRVLAERTGRRVSADSRRIRINLRKSA